MAEGYDNNKLHYIRWRWSSSTHHKTEFKLGLKRLFRRNNKGWGGNCILEWHLAAPHQPLKWFPKVSQCEWVKSFSVNASCWGLLGNSSIQVWDGGPSYPVFMHSSRWHGVMERAVITVAGRRRCGSYWKCSFLLQHWALCEYYLTMKLPLEQCPPLRSSSHVRTIKKCTSCCHGD